MHSSLTDKSLALEAAFWGFGMDAGGGFAEPGIAPNYAPDVGFVLRHIDVHLTIDVEAGTVVGESLIELGPRPAGLGDVRLHFDDLTLDSVQTESGEAVAYTENGGALFIQGLASDGAKVRIRWHGKPGRGMYFPGPTPAEPNRKRMAWTQCQDEMAHFFMPCVDHPSVKCTWDIRVTAPEGMKVISNGKHVKTEGNTWHYSQAEPMPAYLFSVCVGDFDIFEDEGASVPVRYIVPAGTDEATVRRVFEKTPRMIAHLEEVYGHPYPWPRYDQVVVYDFIFGGMENVAATTLTDLCLTDERAALDWNSESLIAHELAHQWFGDLLTCQDWSQGYLNEAWATYSEVIWAVHDLGQDEADYHLYGDLKNYLAECSSRYKRPIVSYEFREPIDMFDRHLYEKGALVLHTLRSELGEAVFWPAVKHYLHTNAHTTVHTRDFQSALEETSGRNLDGFFHDWILSPGHPALKVKSGWSKGLLRVTVNQTQKGDGVPEAYRFGLALRVHTEHGVQEINLPVEERSRTWAIPMAAEPSQVEVDAGFKILANLTVEGPRPWLIASLKNDSSVVGRIRAAAALGKDGSPRAIEALATALSEEAFWGARSEIASVLAKIGTDRARDALLSCIGDEHPKARTGIVSALGSLPEQPAVIDALRAIVTQGDPSIQVEGAAMRSLGRLRAEDTVSLANEMAKQDSWGAFLACRAVEAISFTRNPDVLPLLLEWTQEDKPERARCNAATGLGRLAHADPRCTTEAVKRLGELTQTGGFRLKYSAVAGLGMSMASEALPILRKVHEYDLDGRVRRSAFEGMRRINKSNKGEGNVAKLRKDLEQLKKDNQKLRGRVDLLEHTPADKSK